MALLGFRRAQPIHFPHGLVDVLDVYLVRVERYPVHDGVRKGAFAVAYLVVPVLFLVLGTEYGRRLLASLVDYLSIPERITP